MPCAEHFCASHSNGCLTLSISLRFSPSSSKQSFSFLFTWGRWGVERFNSWPSVTQLVIGKIRRYSLDLLIPKPNSSPQPIQMLFPGEPLYPLIICLLTWKYVEPGTQWDLGSGWLVGFPVPFGGNQPPAEAREVLETLGTIWSFSTEN